MRMVPTIGNFSPAPMINYYILHDCDNLDERKIHFKQEKKVLFINSLKIVR